ncbi:HNH endonuclease [Ectothiorhodospira lacustris]|uniref:HNH endonuclease n=1 Tax=Ectothiorhodospira lacustris TaxID=2899127 RepID=UPI001EE8EAAB|nr:HNH endonuclease [Ectothiorhodospira lacustris]MCG5502267.1 HNH endonuclease [Ectothiorhodospira lacustris]
MANIDRNSVIDARNYISKLFAIHTKGDELAFFLASQIMVAHEANPNNWNLNFNLNGKFIRFNVGQEYCIQIYEHEILVLCLKDELPKDCKQSHTDFFFRGYTKGSNAINTANFNEAPQCLAKVPNSIGLVFNKNIVDWISAISESNTGFIKYAINHTHILPQMIGAHSVGAVKYLSEVTGIFLQNPSFAFKSITENENRTIKRLKNVSDTKLNELAKNHNSQPRKTGTSISIYIRSPYVIEQAKRIANGLCQDCGNTAPFLTKGTNEPFLEVHHVVPLSQGGEDTIENVVALCPNCHRKRHYG